MKFCISFGGDLEGCNEKINKNGEATKGRGSLVKHGKHCMRGMVMKILWDGSPCVAVLWKLLNTSGEYLVDAWLDFVTKLQKYTSFVYSWSTSKLRKKWEAVVAGREKMCENSNLLEGLTFNCAMWWNRNLCALCAWSTTENGC